MHPPTNKLAPRGWLLTHQPAVRFHFWRSIFCSFGLRRLTHQRARCLCRVLFGVHALHTHVHATAYVPRPPNERRAATISSVPREFHRPARAVCVITADNTTSNTRICSRTYTASLDLHPHPRDPLLETRRLTQCNTPAMSAVPVPIGHPVHVRKPTRDEMSDLFSPHAEYMLVRRPRRSSASSMSIGDIAPGSEVPGASMKRVGSNLKPGDTVAARAAGSGQRTCPH